MLNPQLGSAGCRVGSTELPVSAPGCVWGLLGVVVGVVPATPERADLLGSAPRQAWAPPGRPAAHPCGDSGATAPSRVGRARTGTGCSFHGPQQGGQGRNTQKVFIPQLPAGWALQELHRVFIPQPPAGWALQGHSQGQLHSHSMASTSPLLPSTLQLPLTAPAFPPQTRQELSSRCHCGIRGFGRAEHNCRSPLNNQEKQSRYTMQGRGHTALRNPSRAISQPLSGLSEEGGLGAAATTKETPLSPKASLPGLSALPRASLGCLILLLTEFQGT